MSHFDTNKSLFKDLGHVHEKDTLKTRCPFCGHNCLVYLERTTDRKIVVKCTVHLCGVQGPPRATKEAALAAWRIRNPRGPVHVGRLR